MTLLRYCVEVHFVYLLVMYKRPPKRCPSGAESQWSKCYARRHACVARREKNYTTQAGGNEGCLY